MVESPCWLVESRYIRVRVLDYHYPKFSARIPTLNFIDTRLNHQVLHKMDTTSWQSALQSALPKPTAGTTILTQGLDTSQVLGLTLCAATVVAYLLKTTNSNRDSKKYPVVNPPQSFDITGNTFREDFQRNGFLYVKKGNRLFPGKPFRLTTNFSKATILPPSWAHNIQNKPNLHFMKAIHQDFHADYPAFKPFAAGSRDDRLLQSVVRTQLTKYLNKITLPLSAETKLALDLTYRAPTEWKEFQLKDTLLNLIARLSSCLHGIIQRVLPSCRKLLDTLNQGREIVRPVIEERRALAKQGKYTPTNTDTINWFKKAAAGRPYNPVIYQMILSIAAIHTSSDLANETLIHLAQRPKLISELRQEMIQVLSTDGWKKSSLFNMKLLNACLKESQRLKRHPYKSNKPIMLSAMMRMATGNVKLPDGTVIHKGKRTFISTAGMSDPTFYNDPDKFDPYRFIRLHEEPSKENMAHLISTSPHHIAFGHGKHACPGRFFAANELKVLLYHIIMKYNIMLPEGYVSTHRKAAIMIQSDPQSHILLRARQPEIDIDSLSG
ncbi:cytochrome P450 [Stachybotrys elegans]|uniref:Cytochrome P450 n=1 Tax=Stachybotrys elegans TaxID=80388 RepID=A0A8K0WPV6_9HYPO|nr:cytochrome P450 [Stachybotrys elegans]